MAKAKGPNPFAKPPVGGKPDPKTPPVAPGGAQPARTVQPGTANGGANPSNKLPIANNGGKIPAPAGGNDDKPTASTGQSLAGGVAGAPFNKPAKSPKKSPPMPPSATPSKPAATVQPATGGKKPFPGAVEPFKPKNAGGKPGK